MGQRSNISCYYQFLLFHFYVRRGLGRRLFYLNSFFALVVLCEKRKNMIFISMLFVMLLIFTIFISPFVVKFLPPQTSINLSQKRFGCWNWTPCITVQLKQRAKTQIPRCSFCISFGHLPIVESAFLSLGTHSPSITSDKVRTKTSIFWYTETINVVEGRVYISFFFF